MYFSFDDIRKFVHNCGGFIGVGESSGHQYQGHYLQLASVLGAEKETGYTMNYDKYNWAQNPGSFELHLDANEIRRYDLQTIAQSLIFRNKDRSTGCAPDNRAVFSSLSIMQL